MSGCVAGSGDDTIMLPPGVYVLTIVGLENDAASGDLDIKSSLTITGVGEATTIIDGNSGVTGDRVFHLLSGDVTINDLTIQNGNPGNAVGGGIAISGGTLALASSAVASNTAGLDGGIQVGGTVNQNGVFVSDGYFTLELNFDDSVFTGDARWLEIGVRPGGSNDPYTSLTPRQELTPTPYALSLRPGASISGEVLSSGVLSLSNSDALGMGLLVSSANHGVYVLSAATNGVVVESVGNDGVHVNSTGDDGISIGQAGDAGVYVDSAVNYGVYVNAAGNRGLYVAPAGSKGVEVGSSDFDGVVVTAAGQVGFYVQSAGTGVRVNTTTLEGMLIASAGTSGLHVFSANEDGVLVNQAGNPSGSTGSGSEDGFEVQGAQGNGLYVGRADLDGVVVNAAGDDGVSVGTVDDNG